MAHSNKETIEVRDREVMDGRKKLLYKELYVDNCKRASLEQLRGGSIRFRFYPIGAFDAQETRVWLLGLLELSTHIEELENGKK